MMAQIRGGICPKGPTCAKVILYLPRVNIGNGKPMHEVCISHNTHLRLGTATVKQEEKTDTRVIVKEYYILWKKCEHCKWEQ